MVTEEKRSWGMVIDTDKCNGCSVVSLLVK